LRLFWKRKDPVEAGAKAVYTVVAKAVTRGGRVRVEELISASAAVVGEAMIATAGDYDPRQHTHIPGARVLSDKVNRLFCGDQEVAQAPADSVVGVLRDRVIACGFAPEDFPSLQEVIRHFAANIGHEEDWGRVPLSVGDDHRPYIMPLQVAYETRDAVDKALSALAGDAPQRLRATSLALSKALCETKGILDRQAALTLALETINGMSKTAPMTRAAMALLMEKARSGKDSPPA
jgi:hypothetical protein